MKRWFWISYFSCNVHQLLGFLSNRKSIDNGPHVILNCHWNHEENTLWWIGPTQFESSFLYSTWERVHYTLWSIVMSSVWVDSHGDKLSLSCAVPPRSHVVTGCLCSRHGWAITKSRMKYTFSTLRLQPTLLYGHWWLQLHVFEQ